MKYLFCIYGSAAGATQIVIDMTEAERAFLGRVEDLVNNSDYIEHTINIMPLDEVHGYTRDELQREGKI